MRARLTLPITAIIVLTAAAARAQHYQTDFPAGEFRSRQAKLLEQIGTAAVAKNCGI
jgi:hypothetical protein